MYKRQGAHSSETGWRWANIKPVPEYIDRVGRYDRESPDVSLDSDRAAALDGRTGGWMDFAEQIDDRLAIGETMMLGLRLVREGVAHDRFLQRHGESMSDVFGAEIQELVALGLLEVLPDRVRLTHQARLVGNQVFASFLP